MKHTPGPWKAVDIRSTERGKRGIVYYQIKPANGAKSAIGFAGVYEGNNPDADARLIAAAPDLLEFVKDAYEWFGNFCVHAPIQFGGETEMGERAERLLAKATGEKAQP